MRIAAHIAWHAGTFKALGEAFRIVLDPAMKDHRA
jgi:hypothetical protein